MTPASLPPDGENPYRTRITNAPHSVVWAEGFAAGQSQAWDSAQVEIDAILASEARPASVGRVVAFLREPRDSADVNSSLAVAADLIEREFAAGRAAATPSPRCGNCGHVSFHAAATPDQCGCVMRAHCNHREGCALDAGGTVNDGGGVCPVLAATPDRAESVTLYRCESCNNPGVSLSPGPCPSHPYPLRALGPARTGRVYVPAAASPDERLREALTDALDGMLDMRPYVPDYFAEKWDHDGYIERARAALEWRPLAAADREKPDGDA